MPLSSDTPVLLYCTVPDQAVADTLALSLIENRLAACVTIIPAGTSVYRWQGIIEKAHELVLLIKTTTALEAATTTQIKSLHPYDIACILTIPVIGGNPAFLAWIESETGA